MKIPFIHWMVACTCLLALTSIKRLPFWLRLLPIIVTSGVMLAAVLGCFG